jgi:hypothetical protein
VVLVFLLALSHVLEAQGIYLNDSAPDIIVLGNRAYYEVGFRKSNGALAYIKDKSVGQNVSLGSRNECLWGAVFHRGQLLDCALFPSDIVFVEAGIREALLPILPGILFTSEFFAQHRTYTVRYPGNPGMFGDYVSISATNGRVAMYSLYGAGPIRPADLGSVHDDQYVSGSTYYRHAFGTGVTNGGTWSAPTVRVRVSQSAPETIQAYRVDNGLDQFRNLSQKLGSCFTQIVQSPLLKADAVQWGPAFSNYPTLLDQLPSPGILRPVA